MHKMEWYPAVERKDYQSCDNGTVGKACAMKAWGLSLIPEIKEPGMEACTCNPLSVDVDMGRSLELGAQLI